MKKSELRQIIREEIKAISEADDYKYGMLWTKQGKSYIYDGNPNYTIIYAPANNSYAIKDIKNSDSVGVFKGNPTKNPDEIIKKALKAHKSSGLGSKKSYNPMTN